MNTTEQNRVNKSIGGKDGKTIRKLQQQMMVQTRPKLAEVTVSINSKKFPSNLLALVTYLYLILRFRHT